MTTKLEATLFLFSKNKFSIAECENLAKDLDAFNKMEFDLVGPTGRVRCRWDDAYYGIFSIVGKSGALMTSQFKYVGDVHCENLEPEPEKANA